MGFKGYTLTDKEKEEINELVRKGPYFRFVEFPLQITKEEIEQDTEDTMETQNLIGKTREEVIEIMGEPDHQGGTSRKYKTPSIYKYDKYEIHFGPRATDTVCLVFKEDENKTVNAG